MQLPKITALPASDVGRARRILTAETRDVHMAVHAQRELRELLVGDFERASYAALLRAEGGFLQGLETCRARRGEFEELGFGASTDAVDRDLAGLGALGAVPTCAFGWIGTRDELLGALYAAHGVALGRGTFARRVEQELPAAPTRFLGRDLDPLVWLVLTRELNEVFSVSADRPDLASWSALVAAARRTFQYYRHWMASLLTSGADEQDVVAGESRPREWGAPQGRPLPLTLVP